MKILYPFIILTLVLLTTINLWIFSKGNLSGVFANPPLAISQISALLGLQLMSITLLLSTRSHFLEKLFFGMDNMYKWHKVLGAFSFILILVHPLILVTQLLPDVSSSARYMLPGGDLSYNLGIFAIYILVLSFIFIAFVKLPFHIWKFTHQILGIVFILGGIHSLLVKSDVSLYLPLYYWVIFFVVLGISSFIYKVFLYKFIGPKYDFTVEKIERKLDIFYIFLKPIKTLPLFKPGQYFYFSFFGRGISREEHPFSIASIKEEGFLKISAKIVGDYTLYLSRINKGDKAIGWGPYGYFGELSASNGLNQVWIAGGIGVTPFLAMLRNEFIKRSRNDIDFYYLCSTIDEAVHHEEINLVCQRIPNIKYTLWCSEEKRRITAVDIVHSIKNLSSVQIHICGPNQLMNSLKKQFSFLGIPDERIIMEDFTMI